MAYVEVRVSDASAIALKVRGWTTTPTTGMVWIYNWKTASYDYQQAFTLNSSTSTDVNLAFGVDVTPYLDATRHVRMVVRALQPYHPSSGGPFKLQVDLLQLLFG